MMTDARRMRIGFLPFYVDYYETVCAGFPAEKRAVCHRLAAMLREFGAVEWDGEFIKDVASATQVAERLAADPPDCVVAFTSIAVFSSIPMAALRRIECPVLVWNAQQIETVSGSYTMEEIVRNTGQIGTQALANSLVREGRPFHVVTGYESSERTRREIAGFLSAVRAARAVRGARLLAVGDPFSAMLDVAIDEAVLRRHLGIEVVRVDSSEWTRRYEAVPESSVARESVAIRREHPVSEIGNDEFARSVRISGALDALVREHGAQAGSLNCHGTNCIRNPAVGLTACYSLGVQNAQGRPFTCTGDIPTAIAMLILKALSGISMYTEVQVMDERRDAIVIANSGEGEPGICRAGAACAVRGNTNFSGVHGRGLSFAYPLEPGAATLASFTPTPAGTKPYRLIVAEGEILADTLPDAGALAGFFRFRRVSLHEGYRRWLEAGPVHHAATTRGHWTRELGMIAAWLGVELVEV